MEMNRVNLPFSLYCIPTGLQHQMGKQSYGHVILKRAYKQNHHITSLLSSLRAESARAFTGRRCPHSGRGEDFLKGQPDFFTETAVTPERKVEKSFPRWEINRHAEG